MASKKPSDGGKAELQVPDFSATEQRVFTTLLFEAPGDGAMALATILKSLSFNNFFALDLLLLLTVLALRVSLKLYVDPQ